MARTDSALERANQNWGGQAAILDENGNPIRSQSMEPNSNPYGNGGGVPPSDNPMIAIAGLKKNVGFLNWAAGLLLVAGGTGFLILQDKIQDRFDKSDERITAVSEQVTELRINATKQDAKLDRILEKLADDESQRSAKEQ